MKKVAFFTLGCKVNAYDSAYMQELFEKNGYVVIDFGQQADIVVVNTCTVTAVADKKSRAAIRRAALTGKVIVTGCMAQKNAEKLLLIDGVDAVIGTDDRARVIAVADLILAGQAQIDLTHDLNGCGYETMHISKPGERTRGIIKIQEGCDNFCSYCIIPYVRGRSRSRRMAEILNEANKLAKSGAKELVLTGIHIASYSDGDKGLGDVICALNEIPGIRLRLGSIEPGVLDEGFVFKAASSKNLCPHFHLSLQSGSADVLKRMNRKYKPDEYLDFVRLLRKYFINPAVTTDIIAGFPGETQQEHADTMAFIKEVSFSRIHVFPFSAREGTKAYGMTPKIPKSTIRARATELISLGESCENKYIQSMIGQKEEVLFEELSDTFKGCLEGYSRRYIRVAAAACQNELKTVKLIENCGTVVFGE